ncbi:MAG: YebC/PmpR family DNA-binding transcriptional regulator, partial [Solobacterium sp.]|nr:YebC/PmpR family DNA-binding transcriptional regulator [Solobacterium sp.]
VSYNYEHVGLFVFPYEDEEAMLDALMEAEVDVQDITVEDGTMTVTTAFQDFGKGQEAIEKLIPEVEFEICEATMLPNETVTLTDPEDIEAFQKLINMLNEVDDVNKVYTNGRIEE